MRQAIAAAMSRSKREIPHYYLATTIDMQPAMSLAGRGEPEAAGRRPAASRRPAPEGRGAGPARGARAERAWWDGDHAVQSEAIHVGVAISLRGGGLVAPGAPRHRPAEPGRADADASATWSTAPAPVASRSSELSDPTITVTSLGEQGVETVVRRSSIRRRSPSSASARSSSGPGRWTGRSSRARSCTPRSRPTTVSPTAIAAACSSRPWTASCRSQSKL